LLAGIATPGGGYTSQIPRATLLTVLPQSHINHKWAHVKITPSLPHSHTYLSTTETVYPRGSQPGVPVSLGVHLPV